MVAAINRALSMVERKLALTLNSIADEILWLLSFMRISLSALKKYVARKIIRDKEKRMIKEIMEISLVRIVFLVY